MSFILNNNNNLIRYNQRKITENSKGNFHGLDGFMVVWLVALCILY